MTRALMRAMHRPVYEARLHELVRRIVPQLRPGDRVLDVGCGGGALGQEILQAEQCPENVEVVGIESAPRGGEPINVVAYSGGPMPFEDGSFDVVIVADVLHHDERPRALLMEARRVSRRLLIVKDHKPEGPLGQARVSFIDWAANAPYGVPCLYRYLRTDQWRRLLREVGLQVEEELTSMRLYPPIVQQLFGGRLHYFAVCRVIREQEPIDNRDPDFEPDEYDQSRTDCSLN